MNQNSLSRADLFEVGFYIVMSVALFSFGLLANRPFIGLVFGILILGIIPFVNDLVSKDMYDAPYFRCDGCGNLRPEKEKTEWEDGEFCGSCSNDTEQQRRFAMKWPMWIKRLRKN